MENIKIKDLIKATQGALLVGDKEREVKDVVIDSRKANENTLFVAIKGENFDGHDFIEDCYKAGCRMFIVSSEDEKVGVKGDMTIIAVENTELCMGDIAKYYKELHKIPYIGVTGSVGKTTTRDMVYSALSGKHKVLKNIGNLNNHLGVPLTLFNLESKHECAVLEMGMSHFGEIEYLSDMVHPEIAVISNVGLSHVENLGSQEGVLKAKLEITKNFGKDNLLVINGDDKMLSSLKVKSLPYKLKTFGFNSDNDIYCKGYYVTTKNISFVCNINGKDESFEVPTLGEHNILNAMSAIIVGMELGLNLGEIREGLKGYVATGMRLDVLENDRFTVINDCYNASPDSMKSALKVLSSFGDERKVAILGDMFEMGDMSEVGHREVGEACIGNADVLITVGKDSQYILDEASIKGFCATNLYHFSDKEHLIDSLDSILREGDVVLVKASRGMKLEVVVNAIIK